jgi:DUF971 family protein
VTGVPVPQAIHRADREIVITWDAAHRAAYPARYLRLQCPCAQCRDEMTGRPLLDPATVPEDIEVRRLSLVGTYAVRIEWSDGHGTGIYTYEYLQAICPSGDCGGSPPEGRVPPHRAR